MPKKKKERMLHSYVVPMTWTTNGTVTVLAYTAKEAQQKALSGDTESYEEKECVEIEVTGKPELAD